MAKDNHALGGRLRGAGLKVTRPRMAVLAALASGHGPFTIIELQEKARGSLAGETPDLVTMYRILAIFEELGIAVTADFGDGNKRYELKGEGHHHHIICRSCQKVKAIDYCPIDISSLLKEEMEYTQITHSLEFFGICSKCRRG